jgi:hypothetical protein
MKNVTPPFPGGSVAAVNSSLNAPKFGQNKSAATQHGEDMAQDFPQWIVLSPKKPGRAEFALFIGLLLTPKSSFSSAPHRFRIIGIQARWKSPS